MSQENNFIPNQENYKPLTPFQLFVKSNFPFIENTFEALDNYGLYCKIVEYLNNVIENENTVEDNVTALYNAFVSLNNYVSNYFDNLDVQEEINNKLDEMAETGQLQIIVNNLYNELRNEVNQEIESLDEKITNVASGSPAGAYSTVLALTTADPDHTKIYVVTADGYWYYWKESDEQWTAGGVYQSSVDNDTVELLDEKVDNIYDNVYYFNNDLNIQSGKYLTQTGTLANLARGAYVDFFYAKKGSLFNLPNNVRAFLAKYDSASSSDFTEFLVNDTFGMNAILDEDCYVRLSWYYADGSGLDATLLSYLTYTVITSSVKEKITNNLDGKNILNFGDSIAKGDGNSNEGYGKIIATNENMNFYDFSVSGACMSNTPSGSYQVSLEITNAINNVPNNINVDFILLEGGTNDINDMGGTIQIGELLPSYDTTNADLTTFIGAMEKAIDRLRTQWPEANIIYIMVHKMSSRDATRQKQFHEAQKQVCEKWCIPYVNIYDEGQITSYIYSLAVTCFPISQSSPTGYDRTHPNEYGYKQFYVPMIKSKMLEYLRTIT